MNNRPAAYYEEPDDIIRFKSRVGVRLFFLYAAVYAVFVVMNTILPGSMKIHVLLGLNLAVFYGFALIILAVIMGLIYNSVCSHREKENREKTGGPGQ